MFRSSQRQTPRAATRRTPAPRPTPTRRAPARPGSRYTSRNSGPHVGLLLAIGLLVVAMGAGGFLFLMSHRLNQAAPTPAPAVTAVGEAAGAAFTPTPVQSPTPTPPVVSRGAVPGGGEVAPASPVSPATAAATKTAAPAATARPAATATRPAAAGAPAAARPTAAATAATASALASGALASGAPASGAPASGAPASGPLTDANGSPNLPAIAQRMLTLVNADRQANGLGPVAWDVTAALAGQKHSEEMAQFGYMSHWDMSGHGPEYRYSRAGGLDLSQENVYRLVHQWEGGRGAPIEDWEQVVADAEDALMHSPGHRANILGATHTHLGVGIAYNPDTGNVAIAQEFVNRYVTSEPLPKRARPGDRLVLRGALLAGSSEPLVNIAYEPFPRPMTLDQLNKTSTYKSAAEHLAVPPVKTGADGRFVSEFTLPKDAKPGLYHVWLWVKSPNLAEPAQAVDAIIEVSG